MTQRQRTFSVAPTQAPTTVVIARVGGEETAAIAPEGVVMVSVRLTDPVSLDRAAAVAKFRAAGVLLIDRSEPTLDFLTVALSRRGVAVDAVDVSALYWSRSLA